MQNHDVYQGLLGNERVKMCLTQMVEKGMIGNSLLFSGPDGIGKSLFALALAKKLLGCEEPNKHPDMHIYLPEGKIGMHSIESMRRFHEEVYMAPYQAKWKIFLIHDADRMLPYSANALLKTFEEPAWDSLIILLSSSPESLLHTVLSRCRRVYFQPVLEKEMVPWLMKQGIEEERARYAALHAAGSIKGALKIAKEGKNESHQLLLTDLANGKWHTYADLKQLAGDLGQYLEKNKQALEVAAREELMQKFPEDLTAVQKESLEKEIEGAISMSFFRDVESLFATLYSWYRDLHLLQAGGDLKHLVHKEYLPGLQQVLKRGEMHEMEKVQEAISEARLGVQRFLPLSSCLERLFLRLDLI